MDEKSQTSDWNTAVFNACCFVSTFHLSFNSAGIMLGVLVAEFRTFSPEVVCYASFTVISCLVDINTDLFPCVFITTVVSWAWFTIGTAILLGVIVFVTDLRSCFSITRVLS